MSGEFVALARPNRRVSGEWQPQISGKAPPSQCEAEGDVGHHEEIKNLRRQPVNHFGQRFRYFTGCTDITTRSYTGETLAGKRLS